MKMNMPVMEIIKFDSNDVIATSFSGGDLNSFYGQKVVLYQTRLYNYNEATNARGTMLYYTKDVIASFKSNGHGDGVYMYDGSTWQYIGTCNGLD